MDVIQESPYRTDIQLETNVSQKDLFVAYQGAKLFVLHSQEESQGIVFAEAMATGLPVVATNVGGIPYVVENGKTGLLCKYGDSQSMAELTIRLFSNRTLWESASRFARDTSLLYSWDKIAMQICALYG